MCTWRQPSRPSPTTCLPAKGSGCGHRRQRRSSPVKGTPCSPAPLLTTGQARGLADWVAAHDRNLTAVYITHGHGDHRFGLSIILDRFPGARAFALPAVIEQMRQGSGRR